MTINIIVFPWNKYKELFEQGKLCNREFLNSTDNDELWDDSPKFSAKVGNSYSMYRAVYDDTAWLQKTEFPSQNEFVGFVSALVNESFESDLGKRGEIPCIECVISPERVAKLSESAAKVSLDEVREAHSRLVAEGVEYPFGTFYPELETEDFINYVNALIEFVNEVNCTDRCLAIHMG